MSSRIAIIPARGGSKRLPRKNILEFYGKPLIEHSITAALKTGLFEHVVVSTEDEEIAAIARKCGAEVPFLRDAAFDDDCLISEATICAVKQSINHYKRDFKTVVQLMPNCPIRDADLISKMTADFEKKSYNFLISCSEYMFMNPRYAATVDADMKPTPLFPAAYTKGSQNFDKLLCPTGAIWIANVKELFKSNSFYGPDHRFYSIDWKYAIDIDEKKDLELAKAIYPLINRDR